jgi:hypothetical protein
LKSVIAYSFIPSSSSESAGPCPSAFLATFNKPEGPRIFVWRDCRLDVILQSLAGRFVRRDALDQYNVRLDDLPTIAVGDADHRAFPDLAVTEQRGFDFRAGNIVTGGGVKVTRCADA